MTGPLPTHTIRRDGTTSVWMLFGETGEKVAAYTTFGMGHGGGVFTIKTGSGWTREMAEMAFRAHMGSQT